MADPTLVLCECGCGQRIPAATPKGRPRRFVPGHQNYRRKQPAGHVPPRVVQATLVLCACGCGATLPNRNQYGNKQTYIYGHATNRKYGQDEPPLTLRHSSTSAAAIYSRKRKWARKMAVLRAYGGETPTCKCCGEGNPSFLAIDHEDGSGNDHRKSLNSKGGHPFYNWLIREGFPPGFRVLCHNCNMAFGFYGYCPHHPPSPPGSSPCHGGSGWEQIAGMAGQVG